MKRSTPLQRTSALRSKSSLSRKTRLSPRSKTNSYRKRPRDMAYMGFVRKLPCIMRSLPVVAFVQTLERRLDLLDKWTMCRGSVEADHMGARGIGQKADDRTCVPLCSHHHRARTDHSFEFKHMTRDELRAWRAAAIERTQEAWRNR